MLTIAVDLLNANIASNCGVGRKASRRKRSGTYVTEFGSVQPKAKTLLRCTMVSLFIQPDYNYFEQPMRLLPVRGFA